ncbi:MAG: toll/interleukin-1 receptor domain-containing protein [Cyanobacteria bacterium J06650_10]
MSFASISNEKGVEVFLSYAPEDEYLKDELAKHLRLMERQSLISTWSACEITAGSEWAEETDEKLNSADVILLLISADFLASDYRWDAEILRAIERHETGETRVIPIILRAVEWETSYFGKLQALPRGAKPVTSWANVDEAFADIASGVRKAVESFSVSKDSLSPFTSLTESTKRAFPNNDLPRTSIKLIGRDSEKESLHNMLQTDNRSTVIALTGMPGVGKSELALQYAWSYGEHYPGGICWIDAREDDIAIQIVQFAQLRLGLTPPTEDDSIRQLNYCLRNWPGSSERVLVVVDDVDSYNQQIEGLLKGISSRFVFLLTSRQRFDASLPSIILEPLTIQQAVSIFESILPKDLRLEDERSELVKLAEWLGCLPLAIQLVGNYLALDSFCSIVEAYEELKKNSLDDVALDNEDSVKRSAKAAFELSWQQLSSDAKHLGYFLSLFASAPIPWKLVTKATESSTIVCNLRLARLKLVRTHLLRQVDGSAVQIHPLLREFFRGKVQEIDFELVIGSGICEALIPIAHTIPEKPLRQDLLAFTDVYLHIEEVAEHLKAFTTDGNAIAFFTSLIRYYCGQGRYGKARYWAERKLAFVKEKFGEQNEHTALAYKEVGLTAFLQGKLEEALVQLTTALKTQVPVSGVKSAEVADIQVLLAVANRTLGELQTAAQFATSALETRKEFLDNEGLDVAEAKMTLAVIQFTQGQDAQTVEELVSQVLSVRREKLPLDHSDLPETLDLMAKVYEKQERSKEAEAFYTEAKDFNERTLGCNHPQTAFSYNNLAKNYQTQQRYEDAEDLFQKSVDIFKETEILPAAGWCLRNLAVLYAEMKSSNKARAFIQEAIEILSSCLPANHPYIKICADDLQAL